MKDETKKHAQSILKALSNEQVHLFLDAAKFVRSERFAEIVEMAVDHASSTGDTGYVQRSLRVLRTSRFRDPVARYFGDRLGLDFTFTAEGIETKRSGRAPNPRALLHEHVPSLRAPGAVSKRVRKASGSRREAEGGYVDMLDHPARLPGSFGTGKRR